MVDIEYAIRERAYHLWVAGGRRDDDAERHWLAAQREVLAKSLEGFARVTMVDANPDTAASAKRVRAQKSKKRRAA